MRDDFTRFSHILAMDHSNLRNIESIRPNGASAHVGLLLDVIPARRGQEIGDPYYGGQEGFEIVWNDVAGAGKALVESLLEA